jgi:hypothetical protein
MVKSGCDDACGRRTTGSRQGSGNTVLERKGHATDPKRDAAVQFPRKVVETRGQISDADLKAVRDVGYTDANVMEIVALVAMYSLTNFFNNVFDHDKDFPVVTPAGAI